MSKFSSIKSAARKTGTVVLDANLRNIGITAKGLAQASTSKVKGAKASADQKFAVRKADAIERKAVRQAEKAHQKVVAQRSAAVAQAILNGDSPAQVLADVGIVVAEPTTIYLEV